MSREGLEGRAVSLPCQDVDGVILNTTTTVAVTWKFTDVTGNTVLSVTPSGICSYPSIADAAYQAKYTCDVDNGFALVINRVTLQDQGSYYCSDTQSGASSLISLTTSLQVLGTYYFTLSLFCFTDDI